ncbi:hypothetical protein ACKVEX_02255 [Rhodocyclaceae bacterium SMB388]
MLAVRIFALLALLGIGGSLIAWMLTGNVKYRHWAWYCFQGAVLILLVLFGMFAFERIF